VRESASYLRTFFCLSLEEMEKKLIEHVLCKVDGNRTRAAEILGVSVRTVRNKIKKYRLG